jgi:hypothetical protein
LDVGILEDEVDRVSRSDQIEVFMKELRRLRSSGELPRSRRGRNPNFSQSKQFGWISADESTMATAMSDAVFHRAIANKEIRRFLDLVPESLRELPAHEIRDHWEEGVEFFSPEFIQFAISVADHYGWEADETSVFLLTGSTPLIEPLRASIRIREFQDEHGAARPRSRARIVLEFDPWVSKETVAETYEKLRQEVLGKGRKRPTYRELEVFRFVLQNLEEDGVPSKSWSAIGRDWNQKHVGSDWTYSSPEDIRRVYDSVRDRLVNAEYQVWGTEPNLNPPPGGAERGTSYRMYVDHRERGPGDTPRKRGIQ